MDADIELYDLRGLHCPMPVLKTRKKMSDMAAGAKLWVETDDPLAAIDVPNFCREQGHTLLDTIELEAGHRFLIENKTSG